MATDQYSHWRRDDPVVEQSGIENSLHWVLDVVFRRKGHALENLSTIRRLALNLLREEKTICKLGLKAKRHRCAIDNVYLTHIVGI